MREKIARLLCEHEGYEWDELTEKGDLLFSKERFRMDDYCPHTTNPLQLKQCCKRCRRGMVLTTIKQWMQVVGITVGDMPYGFTQEQIDYYAPMLADEIMKVSTSSERRR